MFQAIDLGYAYEGCPPLIKNVNLTVRPGEMVAIMGKNGSGKTTLARLLKGIMTPQKGQVILQGKDIAEYDPAGTAGLIEYLFQNPDNQICQNRVDREITFSPRMLQWEPDKIEVALDHVLKLTNMEKYKFSNPYDLDYYLRKRLALASILVTASPYLILDEPDAGQDWSFTENLSTILKDCKKRGQGIIVITHNSDWVGPNFDSVVLLSEGQVISRGKTDTVFGDKNICLKAGVTPPAITSLGEKLSLDTTVTGPDDFASAYAPRIDSKLISGSHRSPCPRKGLS